MNKLPVNEIFETIQGEAEWTGTPAVFLRLQGCDVGCAWCDTKHTWEVKPEMRITPVDMIAKQEDSEHYGEMSVEDIMQALANYDAMHVVITGGEPCMYDLIELTTAIIDSGRQCQIETSGTYAVKADPLTWITVSPKIGMKGGYKVLPSVIAIASEIKHPVGKMDDIDRLQKEIIPWVSAHADVWLQPLSQSQKATELCIQQATKNNYRVSIQTHKFIGVR